MSADLVAASDELLSVLEQLPEGIFVLDSDSKVIFANKPAMRLVKMKPKKTIGELFPYPLEDGTMRDFDVEMLVKQMTWAGREATMVHLKPLKSAGAFHLEWKLESALEKARAAELLLEEWKNRETPVETGGPPNAELERSLQETSDQLAAARTHEAELARKLEEYQALIEQQRGEFEERQSELESLLELAETRADELQGQLVTGDHQTATELQHAVSLARDAEEQLRALEEDLDEARDRIRVAEEQAEVAEERAYTLEAEIEKLSTEMEELDLLRDEKLRWQSEMAEMTAQLQSLQTQSQGFDLQAEMADLTARLKEREEELAILTDRVEAKDEELLDLTAKLTAAETERGSQMAALQDQLQSRDGALAAREQESAELRERLASTESELAGLRAELDERSRRLEVEAVGTETLSADLTALKAELEVARQQAATASQAADELSEQLREAQEILRVRSEESDELAEQLRAETEQSEELVEQLRQDIERLHESAREQTDQIEHLQATTKEQAEELESLREIAADAESLVSELNELKEAHQTLKSQHENVLAESVGTAELRKALEDANAEIDRLQKELHKLSAQLDDAGDMAEKGELVDKLKRKLEGALRRAEEAEERLEEERRLLSELRQTSERRIAEMESRGARAGGQSAELDPETERMAFQDSLTGLPNRNILHKYLGFMLQQSVRYERYTALLRIDCDKFKVISDTFGTDIGDRLIRLVGERLSAVVRSSDVLGRMGEDEFAILLSELTDQKEASVVTASVIKRIYHMLKKPFSIDGQSISVSVSIGVSLYPLDAANGEQMFQHAAEALRRAKETGRGQAQYYTPEVQSNHESKIQRDHELKSGLERGEFSLVYQPIFDLSNGQVVGVEALIRWNHSRLGPIGPDEFLKVAEESGLIVLIGNWALRTALQRAAQWQAAGLNLFVSLNLSRRQLLQADLIPTIHTALVEFRCSPDRILLEISEELTGPELPRLRDTLTALQQLGVRLAVDNFGTSASSLQELRRGPFQVLKIDRRFVRGVPAHEENTGIVLSALTLGHHLGRITVAVGIETEAEKSWLAKTGCRFAQGNLLSQPLPPEHVVDIATRR